MFRRALLILAAAALLASLVTVAAHGGPSYGGPPSSVCVAVSAPEVYRCDARSDAERAADPSPTQPDIPAQPPPTLG